MITSRFNAKIERGPGCWNWIGPTGGNAYGYLGFYVDGKEMVISAHRLSWIIAHGSIPPGLCVLHKCDNRMCVNPAHLFLGTIADNNADMWTKGRGQAPVASCNAAKTHCLKGHLLAGDNLYLYKGYRHCRECRRLRSLNG